MFFFPAAVVKPKRGHENESLVHPTEHYNDRVEAAFPPACVWGSNKCYNHATQPLLKLGFTYITIEWIYCLRKYTSEALPLDHYEMHQIHI